MAIKYSKQQYLAKIDALEGYKSQLQNHLDTLENYREQIYSFWDDEQARQLYKTLNKTTHNVRVAMDRTQESINMHKKTVDQMEEVQGAVSTTLEIATSVITALGKK